MTPVRWSPFKFVPDPEMRRRQQEAVVRRWERDVVLLAAKATAGDELAAVELRSALTSLAYARAVLDNNYNN